MRLLIIEDEVQAAWNLEDAILKCRPDVTIAGVLESLRAVKDWFKNNASPHLIFSDIQLGDGIVFDVLRELAPPCPIIFCTAYDEYLLQAFQANGIDYLLKPIDEKELKRSFEKLAMLERSLAPGRLPIDLGTAISEILERKKTYKTSFLVPYRDRLIPVEVDEISYFRVNESEADLALLDGRVYQHSFTLDYLASVLDPSHFFRASRQYLVALNAIKEIEHYEDRKLLLHLKHPCREKITVSKAKAPEFLRWMQER